MPGGEAVLTTDGVLALMELCFDYSLGRATQQVLNKVLRKGLTGPAQIAKSVRTSS